MVRSVPDRFSYHLLMRSSVVIHWNRAYRIHAEPYKQNPNLIRKGIRYVSDPVSCKQGLSFHPELRHILLESNIMLLAGFRIKSIVNGTGLR